MRKIGDNMKLSDKKIVITGSLRPMTREEVILFLKEQGATVQGFKLERLSNSVPGHQMVVWVRDLTCLSLMKPKSTLQNRNQLSSTR